MHSFAKGPWPLRRGVDAYSTLVPATSLPLRISRFSPHMRFFMLLIPRLFYCCCVLFSAYNDHNFWGRGLYYTVPRWMPKYSFHDMTKHYSLCQRVLFVSLPSSPCLNGVIQNEGGTCKRYSNTQVRVRPRVINTNNKYAFNEQWFLLGDPTFFYTNLIGLRPLACVHWLPFRYLSSKQD